jgi:hypothetical protein
MVVRLAEPGGRQRAYNAHHVHDTRKKTCKREDNQSPWRRAGYRVKPKAQTQTDEDTGHKLGSKPHGLCKTRHVPRNGRCRLYFGLHLFQGTVKLIEATGKPRFVLITGGRPGLRWIFRRHGLKTSAAATTPSKDDGARVS